MSEPTVQSPCLRREIASAYAASTAKVLSWAAVSAIIYRKSPTDFAILALVRATIGILNYTSLGLGPAMVRLIAVLRREQARAVMPVATSDVDAFQPTLTPAILEYQSAATNPLKVAYVNGFIVAILATVAGALIVVGYSVIASKVHRIPPNWNPIDLPLIIIMVGLATLTRLFSDVSGALLQSAGRIVLDNTYQSICEIAWLPIVIVVHSIVLPMSNLVEAAAASLMITSFLLWLLRTISATRLAGPLGALRSHASTSIIAQLLSMGLLITFAQLADFLYAPTDYILISYFLGPAELAAYAPAVQIDGALLLLVAGVASVLLPRTAIAHATDDLHTIRRYYIKGTLYSTAVLAAASLIMWLSAPLLLRLWLGPGVLLQSILAILPLVLLHTVAGGSSAVGRSILLAIGKVKPFAASVLIAGIANVLLSFVFVRYLHLGLRGIVYGTLCAVFGRCVIWTPWYVLHLIRSAGRPASDEVRPASVRIG